MKTQSIKQFAIVRSDTASQFEQLLNEKLIELNDRRPEVTFAETGAYMIARISYTNDIVTEETPPEKAGIIFNCGDCPKYKDVVNKDGSLNKTCKRGDCTQYGIRTRSTADACEWLYNAILNGGVKLCFSESE